MTNRIEIRESRPGDIDAIGRLYPQAFPDENLLPLVRDLLGEAAGVLSLIAMSGPALAGHVIFTECGLSGGAHAIGLLGPLAVAPGRQKRGIGTKLVHAGFERLRARGITAVCVLGDPAYYGHFGFRPEAEIETPCPIPDEWRDAWQSLALDGGKPAAKGRLAVPPPWRQPSLWA